MFNIWPIFGKSFMTTANVPRKSSAYLKEQLEQQAEKGFTGKLEVTATNSKWDLFFCLGRLVWATDSQYPHRRFRRTWQQTYPRILQNLPKNFPHSYKQPTLCQHYEFLRTTAKQKQLTQTVIHAIVRSNCQEVLFDILQNESWETLTYQALPEKGLDKASILMSGLLWPRQIFPEAQQEWLSWQQVGLQNISPHQVPTISQPEKLQQMTAPTTYQVLVKAIDGRRSLRDLAIATSKELWRLGKSLLPYVRQGVIELKTVEDSVGAIASSRQSQSATPTSNQKSKQIYIACIDDSVQIQKQMQHIANQAGWHFVGIQNSVQTLPKLLESPPNLIFLDLVMPIANGYEICAQIRRVKTLQSIPVIILTSQDGAINQARARLVGANSFLSKPIQPDKIRNMVQQYAQ
jgi:chemotaxis family two-component system response regulator PixG